MSDRHKKNKSKVTAEVVKKTEQSVTVIDDGWSRRRFVQSAAKAVVSAGGGVTLLHLAKIDSVFAAGGKDSKLQDRALRKAFPSDAEYGKAKEAIKVKGEGAASLGDECLCGCSCPCACPCTCTCTCSGGCRCTCECECKCDCQCFCPCTCTGECNCTCNENTAAGVYSASLSAAVIAEQQTPAASGVGAAQTPNIQAARTPARDTSVQGSVGPDIVATSQAEQSTAIDATIGDAGAAEVVSTKVSVHESNIQSEAAGLYTKVPNTSTLGGAALLIGLGGLGWHYLRKKALRTDTAA